MKKSLLLLMLAGLLLGGCSRSQRHTLSVSVPQWGNDTVFIFFSPEENDIWVDTVMARHGKIYYDYEGEDTVMVSLINGSSIISYGNGQKAGTEAKILNMLISGNSALALKGEMTDDCLNLQVLYESGLAPDFCKDMIAVREESLPYMIKKDSLFYEMVQLWDGTTMPNDTVLRIYDNIQQLMASAIACQMEYARTHPDSQLSAMYLCDNNDREFDVETLATALSLEVQNGMFKERLQQRVAVCQEYKAKEARKKAAGIAVGSVAPDFRLSNLKNRNVSLSAFRGKWVVLDFWGSWCSWCIKGIPDMKEAYRKHHSNMEIVSIDCRDSDKAWREAVAKYQMPWVHLYNGEGEGNISTKYFVEGYPTKILIDPQGVIAQIFVGESADFYQFLDETIK